MLKNQKSAKTPLEALDFAGAAGFANLVDLDVEMGKTPLEALGFGGAAGFRE